METLKKQLNILLIMPTFYNLSQVIVNELTKEGHKVTFIENKIFKEDFRLLKTFMSGFFFIINPFYKIIYTKQVIQKIENRKFDLLLTIGHLSTTHALFKHLKDSNPKIKTVLYLWDSFSAWDFSFLLDYFDYKYSFDREDCKKFAAKNLIYFPLFFDFNDEQNIQKNLLYDITHIGTINKYYNTRLKILNAIIRQTKALGIRTYIRVFANVLNSSFFKRKKIISYFYERILYLFDTKFRKHINLVRKNIDKGFMFSSSLNQKLFNQIENQSKCILDINVDVNTGISNRVIRAIAMGKKVITTNTHIINEDFYDPDNIYILDKDNPVIDMDFVNKPFKKVDIYYLRVDKWISKIFKDIHIYD